MVSYDNKITMNNTSGAFVVGSNANRILIINSTTPTTAPTYNGVAFTKYNPASGIIGDTYVWYLINPAVGSHTLDTTGSAYAICGSFYNVNTVSPFKTITAVTQTTFGDAGVLSQTISISNSFNMALCFSYENSANFDQVNLGGSSAGQVDFGVLFNDRLNTTAWSYKLNCPAGNNTLGRYHAGTSFDTTHYLFLLEVDSSASPLPTHFII